MKSIIQNKVYNTETAELIHQNNYSYFGDPEGYSTSLYKNEDGFYFTHTSGGENSKYPRETIKRISVVNAKKWIKDHKD